MNEFNNIYFFLNEMFKLVFINVVIREFALEVLRFFLYIELKFKVLTSMYND